MRVRPVRCGERDLFLRHDVETFGFGGLLNFTF